VIGLVRGIGLTGGVGVVGARIGLVIITTRWLGVSGLSSRVISPVCPQLISGMVKLLHHFLSFSQLDRISILYAIGMPNHN
jgi:hypothetical protein